MNISIIISIIFISLIVLMCILLGFYLQIKKRVGKISKNNLVFISLMIIVYILLNFLLCLGNIQQLVRMLVLQIILIIVALSPIGEFILRFIYGVREVKTNKDKERLLSLFMEVYDTIKENEKYNNRDIRLYIDESMTVNAYAMGTRTIVITKGAMESLPDNQIKGLFAHELRTHYKRRYVNTFTVNCWKPFYATRIFYNKNN